MSKSKIPYCERNWETTGGCDKIKSGCQNCYAIKLIHRFSCNPVHKGRYKGLIKDGNWTGKIKLFEDRLEQPLHRWTPTTYFVNSRSDLFHKDVPWEFIDKIHAVMALCPQHTFLLFTKRWERALKYYTDETYGGDMRAAVIETNAKHLSTASHREAFPWLDENCGARLIWPQANVHLYFSASTQAEVDEAWRYLNPIPAAVKGWSLEPLLENIIVPPGADGVIIGAESGPNRRPCKLEWIESLVSQCQNAGTSVYVKQIEIDGKVCSDVTKFPEHLQVRGMPI